MNNMEEKMDDIVFLLKQLDLAEEAILKAWSHFPSKAIRQTPGKRQGRYQHLKGLVASGDPKYKYLSPNKHRDYNDSKLKRDFGITFPKHLQISPQDVKSELTQATQRLGYAPSGAPKLAKLPSIPEVK